MRIDEITSLVEDTADGIDIMSVSRKIADYMVKHKPAVYFNITDVAKDSTLPRLRSGAVTSLLYDRDLLFNISEPNAARRKHNMAGSFLPIYNEIWINIELINDKPQIVKTLSHEMQHALDYYKSRTKALPPFKFTTYDAYLALPPEINARFMEALIDIVRAEGTAKGKAGTPSTTAEGMKLITAALDHNQLEKALFDKMPDGQRKYNRLRSRAYKFHDEVKHLIIAGKKEPKATLFSKIKALIKKYVS